MLATLKNYIIKLAVIIIIGLTAFCVYLNKQIERLDKDLALVTNNYRQYETLANGLLELNRTLQLTIDDLVYTRDSLLINSRKILRELKIKDRNLSLVQVINTEMKDTITKVIHREVDFKEELKLNPLTTILIERRDSVLSAVLDLRNELILFVEEKKEYRRKYKNWFRRLLHFDFKKDINRRYQIHNSNKLIKVTDTRIVEVTQ